MSRSMMVFFAVLVGVGSASADTFTRTVNVESSVVDPSGMSGKVALFVDVSYYQAAPTQRLIPRKDVTPADVEQTFELTPAGGAVPSSLLRNGVADPVTIFFIQPDRSGASYGGLTVLSDEPTFLFDDASGAAGIDLSGVSRYRVWERLDALTLTPITEDAGTGFDAVATYTLTIETSVPDPAGLAVVAPSMLGWMCRRHRRGLSAAQV